MGDKRIGFNFPSESGRSFSQATRVGPWILVSGQVSTVDGRLVGAGDAEAQARQCFANMKTLLEAAGASLADVAKLTCYVVDPAVFPAYAKVKAELFPDNPPAGTTVVVAGLIGPGNLLEVEAMAYRPAG
jgi:enamine deaminase RidA (YjgF/YER057c/UK114 family)